MGDLSRAKCVNIVPPENAVLASWRIEDRHVEDQHGIVHSPTAPEQFAPFIGEILSRNPGAGSPKRLSIFYFNPRVHFVCFFSLWLSLLEAFLLQVVDVEPVVNDPVARDELGDVVLDVFLSFSGQIAQAQVALLVVPLDDFDPRTFLGVLSDPGRDLAIGCAGGDERLEGIIVIVRMPIRPPWIKPEVKDEPGAVN